MNRDLRAFLLGGSVTLVLSFPAMVAFMTLFTRDLSTTLSLASRLRIEILAGYLAMATFLAMTAPVASRCCKRAVSTGLYFVAVFLIGVVIASVASLMVQAPEPWETNRFDRYFVGPVKVLGGFGVIPAFLVGLIGWVFIRAFGRGRPSAGPAT